MKSPQVTDCWGAWAEMEGWLQVCHQVGSYAVACWTQEHDEVGASCPWSASAAERSCRLDRALAVPRGALAVLAVPGLQETNERRKEEKGWRRNLARFLLRPARQLFSQQKNENRQFSFFLTNILMEDGP